MKYTLLINRETLTSLGLIDSNVDEQYIRPSTIKAQEIDLVQLIGENLYNKLCSLIPDAIDLPENANYKDLLDNYIAIYLAYTVMAEIQLPIQYKICNKGIVSTTDDKLISTSMKDCQTMVEFYSKAANYFGNRITSYLCHNTAKFPEYAQTKSGEVAPNKDYLKNIPFTL